MGSESSGSCKGLRLNRFDDIYDGVSRAHVVIQVHISYHRKNLACDVS